MVGGRGGGGGNWLLIGKSGLSYPVHRGEPLLTPLAYHHATPYNFDQYAHSVFRQHRLLFFGAFS